MFLGFSKLKINQNRLINIISSATFGVYLIHDDIYIRPFLWKNIIKCASFFDSNLLIPYSLAVIAGVYVVCTLIELIRIHSIEKVCIPIINNISKRIDCA